MQITITLWGAIIISGAFLIVGVIIGFAAGMWKALREVNQYLSAHAVEVRKRMRDLA